MENLGEIFINGKTVNLDSTDVKDLEEYLRKVQDYKKHQKEKLNNYLGKIYS